MAESDFYSDSDSEYMDFTEEEMTMIRSYNYDDYKAFSDVKLFDMQNSERLENIWEKYDIHPCPGSFCTIFNVNSDRNKLIQRHLCDNNCFWNPRQCFLSDSHSGNLADLMHKNFHDKFNPDFEEHFKRNFSGKIDWAPTGGLGNNPSVGLKNFIKDLGITTKLVYDNENYAINFDNLCRKFRDSIPVRPLFIMEEKKCHDIIEALLNTRYERIENNWKEMTQQYGESYKGNGTLREPILSLMMWGPQIDYNLKKTDEECKYDTFNTGPHVCTNFSEKHFWMYTHSTHILCKKGAINVLEGPVMTREKKIVYPCNRSGCNHDCLCFLCTSKECSGNEHMKLTEDFGFKCSVNKNFYCKEHEIKHPKSFDTETDISVEKYLYYHNLNLQKNPRKHSTGNLVFAGIKRNCEVCRSSIHDHFKHHKILHLHCPFCVYTIKTADDPRFWDKVCDVCGKIFENIKSLQYWHRRLHYDDWSCEECDIHFNRKWNLKRHLLETHGMECEGSNHGDEEGLSDSTSIGTGSESEKDTDIEISDEHEMEPSEEDECEDKQNILNCKRCGKTFTRIESLKRHEEVIHNDKVKAIKCDVCGASFTRSDNLQEHKKRAHLKETENFTCKYCERKFDRKFNQVRHEERCKLKI